ncbi:MAG: DUF1285 domain-containing protein [Deltaproteobacteria bacterium]|nr:DUF1285 domain-containing protein [Deltaproteobacteria bacterium]
MENIKKRIKEICDIKIDKDGVWYYRGAEMLRADIVQYLYGYLKKTPGGSYYLEVSEHDRCEIDVEDTAFVVKSVERVRADTSQEEVIHLSLSDGSSEVLEPDTLTISEENVLYCRIKKNSFRARFSRKSYYQMISDVQYDDQVEKYFLNINGKRCFIEGNNSQ